VYAVATFIIWAFFEISNLWKFDKEKTAGVIAVGVGVLLLIRTIKSLQKWDENKSLFSDFLEKFTPFSMAG
jgi:multisubunit Na+/H+ antiporter MnhB subunit